MNSDYPIGSPQRYAEDLYWQFSEFDLETDQVKKCCFITLQRLMQDGDTAMRLYYNEAKKFIQSRG